MGSRTSPLKAIASSVVVVVIGVGMGGAGCRPLLDGGWEGTATCNGDVFPLTGVFNENADGEVDGIVYIENIVFGFNGIAKGVIEDGERDPEDGSYAFDLETDGDDAPDFAVAMEYEDDKFEELDGTVDILDNDGVSADTCALKMDRVSVND